MQTLRKALEHCLLAACPLFPFDLADQQVAVAASLSKVAQAAAAGPEAQGGTLVFAISAILLSLALLMFLYL
jgi:hypothetical protein